MKARHFAKLRKQLKYFEVLHTCGLFGTFNGPHSRSYPVIVLAKNPVNAIRRAKRRGYGIDYEYDSFGSKEKWAHWKVKLQGASDHFRNVEFF